jgi:hypothetical protein
MSFVAPDWRVESNYADPKNETNLSFWAWEFLRRSPAYNASWAEYVASLCRMAQRLPDQADYIKHIIAGTNAPVPIEQSEAFHEQAADALELMHFSPPRQGVETFDEWAQRDREPGTRFCCTPLDQYLGGKHQLENLVNPSLSFRAANGFARVQFKNSGLRVKHVVNGRSPSSRATVQDMLWGSRMTLEFDLESPDTVLVAQLKAALKGQRLRIKNNAETVKKVARPKGSLTLFRTYLRVLDAMDAGCKPLEIVAEIEPHKDKEQQSDDIANWTKRAIELRDVQCVDLPAYTEIAVKRK